MLIVIFRGKPQTLLKKMLKDSQNIGVIAALIFLHQELQDGKESGTFTFVPMNLVLCLCNELGPSSAPISDWGKSHCFCSKVIRV